MALYPLGSLHRLEDLRVSLLLRMHQAGGVQGLVKCLLCQRVLHSLQPVPSQRLATWGYCTHCLCVYCLSLGGSVCGGLLRCWVLVPAEFRRQLRTPQFLCPMHQLLRGDGEHCCSTPRFRG